jgi:hypothetical protein
MLICNRTMKSRVARLGSIVTKFIAAAGVAGVTALLVIRAAVGAEPPAKAQTEQWGPQQGDLQTRLVPLADHFTLGQPMKFRLELKNVGRTVIHYDPQAVDMNGSLSVKDPQGNAVRYVETLSQSGIDKLPALTPGNVVNLFDGLDLDSRYLIVKPGKYTVQFTGYGLPKSNIVEIEVQPGTLPPIKRIAARLLDVLPNNWEMTIHDYSGESDRNRIVGWDEPPPGWEPVRVLPTIELAGDRTMKGGVAAHLWLSDRKLEWTGKVARPGQAAPLYLGKCPEGHVYANLPSDDRAATAKWPTFERDFKKALQVEPEKTVLEEVKSDDDLKRLEGLSGRDILYLDNTGITDTGLKYLEGLPQLKSLWLCRTGVTDQGLKSLAKLTHLEQLWLDGDQITDAGLENLKGLAQLESLSLYGTKITDAGLEKLKGLTRLQHLTLGNTAVTDAGLETIKGFAGLHSLILAGTRITDAGMQRIKGLTQIERLSLANTQITDAGLEYLKGLTRLTSLDLNETHVTDEGVARLQQVFPQCELLYKSAEQKRKWLQALEEQDRRGERVSSAIFRVQSTAESSLKKYYIVQFDKPGLKRQSLVVIVWKAKDTSSITLDHLDKDAPVIEINSHLITPPPAKKAVYALQGDYSLQQLSLTEDEIGRLFSHITRSEERAVSSDDVRILPPDPYWEEKVDPHLKVVEPDKKEKRQ